MDYQAALYYDPVVEQPSLEKDCLLQNQSFLARSNQSYVSVFKIFVLKWEKLKLGCQGSIVVSPMGQSDKRAT